MMIHIELTEQEIRQIIADHLSNKLNIEFIANELPIEVKSKQNYRSEWEEASIRIKTKITKE